MPACRFTPLAAAVLATALAGVATAGPVYQWKDAKGVTHSSDKPPVGVHYEVRRIDVRDTATSPQTVPAGQPVEPPACTTARANLEILQADGPVEQEIDGERRTLDDEQRAAQKRLAEAAIRAYCPPA